MSRGCRLGEGLAAVVTGAGSGIGRCLAVALAERYKARLVLNARSKSALLETANLIRERGGQAVVAEGDIGDRLVSGSLPGKCVDNFGRLDIIVNNAGLAKPGPVTSLTPDDWHRVFDVNFFGPLATTYAALPYFFKQGAGKIVNISSVAGKVSFPGSVCYAASKFALTGLSEGLAAELSHKNIDVITVCPGWVRTEFFTKNQVSSGSNPTLISLERSFRGWIMKNLLSISPEQATEAILQACRRGGCHELVLTGSGVFIERLSGIFPSLAFALAARIPSDR